MKLQNLFLILVATTVITARAANVKILEVDVKAGTVDYIAAPFQAGQQPGTSVATGNQVYVNYAKDCGGLVSEVALYGKTVQPSWSGVPVYGLRYRIPVVPVMQTNVVPTQTLYATSLFRKENNQAEIWEVGFKGTFKNDCRLTFTQSLDVTPTTYVANGVTQELDADCTKATACTADFDAGLLFCSSKNLKTEATLFEKAQSNRCTTTAALKAALCKEKAELKQYEVTCYSKYNFQ